MWSTGGLDMEIVITGGLGYVGSHVAVELSKEGAFGGDN